MKEERVVVRLGTSWGAAVCGWVAAVGMAALLSTIVSAQINSTRIDTYSMGAAVPVLIALMLSTFVGGYVSGRIAGYRTSWHGLMTGFFGMLVVYTYMLLQMAAQQGMFGLAYYAFPEAFPGVLTVGLYQSYPALGFGLLMGYAAQLFAAWLGGLLAPEHRVAVPTTTYETRPPRGVPTEGGRLQPSR